MCTKEHRICTNIWRICTTPPRASWCSSGAPARMSAPVPKVHGFVRMIEFEPKIDEFVPKVDEFVPKVDGSVPRTLECPDARVVLRHAQVPLCQKLSHLYPKCLICTESWEKWYQKLTSLHRTWRLRTESWKTLYQKLTDLYQKLTNLYQKLTSFTTHPRASWRRSGASPHECPW